MRNTILSLFLMTAAALGEQPASVFPRASWFRQHFASPQTRVELQSVRRLSDFVVNGKLELNLKAYIELALANNTDIALARLQVETPRNAIERAFGDFDPKLTASFSNTHSTQTSLSNLDGQPTIRTVYQPFSGTYSQMLSTGTSFSAQFSASRSTSNYVYNTYNPVLNSSLSLAFSQPLLRNRGASLTRMSILSARSTLRISQYQLKYQLTNYVAAGGTLLVGSSAFTRNPDGTTRGDFALDHEDGERERGVGGGELEQDLRGDAVGQVAEDKQALAGGGRGWRIAGEGRCEVEAEHVLLDDGDAAGRELGAQISGEAAVQLHGQNVGGARGEGSGDSPGAGADFNHSAAGEVAQRSGDALRGLRVAEKVLSKLGFGGHRAGSMVDESARLSPIGKPDLQINSRSLLAWNWRA